MPTSYLSPGVYIEDTDRGPAPITGVATSIVAFVGFAAKGPVNHAVMLTTWSQFEEIFGGFLSGAFLPYAVHGFFANGGSVCFIVRLPTLEDGSVPDLPAPQAELLSRKPAVGPTMLVTALEEDEQDAGTVVEIRDSEGDTFTLIARSGFQEEVYSGIRAGRHGDKSVESINQQSRIVQVTMLESSVHPTDQIPIMGHYRLAVPTPKVLEPFKIDARTFSGDLSDRSGINGLGVVEEITLICVPDLMNAYIKGALDEAGLRAAQLALIAHCEQMGDRMCILDAPPGLSPQQVARWRRDVAGYDTKFAALYYPWLEAVDIHTGEPFMLPPSGHVAGIYARVDNAAGIHKAPANERIHEVWGVETPVSRDEQEILNPLGVNCLREFPGHGIRVWGARTLSSDASWRYVNVRRILTYIERSIREGTQWVVFEPNDHSLWSQIERDVADFLRKEWERGVLIGDSPGQAFYVKCDEELNTSEVRDKGQLIIEIGVAPVKPAEFVIFRITQWSGGAVGGA